MTVWVITTCVPGEPEPCWPSVYSTEEKAEAAFAALMRDEWGANTPEDDDGNPKPFPDDAHEAHEKLIEWCGNDWGQWEIYPVEIDAGDMPEVQASKGIGVEVRP